MNTENSILEDFEESFETKTSRFFFTVVILELISILTKYIYSYFYFAGEFNIPFFIGQSFPLIILLLFYKKKKSGWVLISFINLLTLAMTINTIIDATQNWHPEYDTIQLLIANMILTLILPLLIVILLFTKSMSQQFSISSKNKAYVIFAAIATFGFIKIIILQK